MSELSEDEARLVEAARRKKRVGNIRGTLPPRTFKAALYVGLVAVTKLIEQTEKKDHTLGIIGTATVLADQLYELITAEEAA